MKCPNCGQSVLPSMKACPYCSALLSATCDGADKDRLQGVPTPSGSPKATGGCLRAVLKVLKVTAIVVAALCTLIVAIALLMPTPQQSASQKGSVDTAADAASDESGSGPTVEPEQNKPATQPSSTAGSVSSPSRLIDTTTTGA